MTTQSLPISAFCKTGSGTTPSRSKHDLYFGGGIPWVKSGELRESVITETEETVTKEALAATPLKIAPKGALLVAMYGANVGRVGILGIDATTNQAICHIVPEQDKADSKYIFHVLRQKLPEFISRSVGGAQPNISQQIIRETEIPLPPIAEQKRIAAILDKAEELRGLRRQALGELDAMTQSIFLEMFGDPVTNSKGWECFPLMNLCDIDAPLVDPRKPEYLDLLHYGPDRISRDTGELLPAKTAREDGIESVKFLFDEHCVLYSKIRPYLNKVALTKEKGLCSADVYPVKPKAGVLVREFLWRMLLTKDFLEYASGFSNRANIPKINRNQFLNYSMICPPLPLQQEFARRVEAIEQLKATHRESLAQLDALFASLQHRAFRGEL